MWIRLDLAGIIFHFKVTDYVETTMDDRFDKWCITDGCIEYPDLHIDLQGEVLLANEIDMLAYNLDELLNDRLSETRNIECTEPILSFVLYPKEDLRKNPQYRYVQEGHEIADVKGEMIVHLWSNGALTNNSIHLALRRKDLEALLIFFRYVKHDLAEQSVEVVKLLKDGIFQKEYS